MARLTLSILLGLMFTVAAFAQSTAGFEKRFDLVKNEEGRVIAIKLKKATTKFTIMPFIEQIKSDILGEQQALMGMNEAEIDELLYEMGLDPYAKSGKGSEEARRMKEALLNIKNIDVEAAFAKLKQGGFWKKFEQKLKEAFMLIDPTMLAHLDDPKFFLKRKITYQVVMWALDAAKKHFSELPILNIASFVIVRVHDQMLEQRLFHHSMLQHYFETVSEDKLGMTKEQVDRAFSSIYEYKIEMNNFPEFKKAQKNWLSYGLDKYYMMVRAGNNKIRTWQAPLSRVKFDEVTKLNYAFAKVSEKGAQKIYHLHLGAHMFTQRPALAYDYSDPRKVKRMRSLLNLAGVGIGFLQIPEIIKSNVQNFLHSMYVEQVRMEGALVGYFEATGDTAMLKAIYAQRANFYILE